VQIAIQAKASPPVCSASPAVPVTTVPTGEVKLHQVSEKAGRGASPAR
jgi:hypothetical protein